MLQSIECFTSTTNRNWNRINKRRLNSRSSVLQEMCIRHSKENLKKLTYKYIAQNNVIRIFSPSGQIESEPRYTKRRIITFTCTHIKGQHHDVYTCSYLRLIGHEIEPYRREHFGRSKFTQKSSSGRYQQSALLLTDVKTIIELCIKYT